MFIGGSEDLGVDVEKKRKNVEEQADRRGGTASSKVSIGKLVGLDWQARR